MTVTPEEGSDRVSFAASQEQHISPNSRKLISIEANPPQAHSLSSGKEAIELVPTSANNLPDDIKVIPCLNYLSPTFQTKIMVENCGDREYIFLKGDMICCSWINSYDQINQVPEAVTNMWIGPADSEEINSVELTEDQAKHQASICLLYTSPSPRDS